MMTLTTSTVFALAGTGLFAIAIFVPHRERKPASSTVSFAPPPVERWTSRGFDDTYDPWSRQETRSPQIVTQTPIVHDLSSRGRPTHDAAMQAMPTISDAALEPENEQGTRAGEPTWPLLIDASAMYADAQARIALADALVDVDTDWSRTILARALADEPDAIVRERLASDRTGRRVRPTPAYADES